MTYGPMTQKIKRNRGRWGEVMSSYGKGKTAYEEGEARGITSGTLVKKRSKSKDYAAQSPEKLDFFTKYLVAQDDKFNKIKEFKTANADGFTLTKEEEAKRFPNSGKVPNNKDRTGPPKSKLDFNLVGFVANFENFSPTPYSDYKQKSIGFGSKSTGPKQKVTEEQGMRMLEADLKTARTSVEKTNKKHGYKFTKNQIEALTSFTHNTGATNLNRLVDNGNRNINEIYAKIPEYNKAGGKKLDGLVKRRLAEQKLFKDEQ